MDMKASQLVITQNLVDAGCTEQMIRQFWDLALNGRQEAALALLQRHRQNLLDCCHAQQRKIDCLDYLVYEMTKTETTTMGRPSE